MEKPGKGGLLNLRTLFLGTLFMSQSVFADESLLLQDEFLLLENNDFNAPPFAAKEKSWRDYFVGSLSHDQTRTDNGDTRYLRYAARVEYEQGFAKNWYTRVDVKARSYRSLDQQALQRGQSKGQVTGDSYQKIKLQDAWLQYSKGACVLKAGNQTLIWGEVDGTFTVDDVTPFDFTEQLLTDYSSVRLEQAMLVSECFLNKQQAQLFYTPKAQMHLLSHNKDPYGLKAASGIDDEDLDSEWGARYKFKIQKTELALMFASLISNAPAQVLADPLLPFPAGTLLPALSEYELYGISANHTSGSWQFKSDFAYKTDQLVDGTVSKTTDSIEAAVGFEYLSKNNHNLSAGIWGGYQLENDLTPDQNDSTPFLTLAWSKRYLNDDLDMRLLANGREDPKSISTTAQAIYQHDDYWTFSGALTLADVDAAAANPLQSGDNEMSLQIKYQF